MSSNVLQWTCPPGFHARQLRNAAKSLREYAAHNRNNGFAEIADIQEEQARNCDAKAAAFERGADK